MDVPTLHLFPHCCAGDPNENSLDWPLTLFWGIKLMLYVKQRMKRWWPSRTRHICICKWTMWGYLPLWKLSSQLHLATIPQRTRSRKKSMMLFRWKPKTTPPWFAQAWSAIRKKREKRRTQGARYCIRVPRYRRGIAILWVFPFTGMTCHWRLTRVARSYSTQIQPRKCLPTFRSVRTHARHILSSPWLTDTIIRLSQGTTTSTKDLLD